MTRFRYLFAFSSFKLDLLGEAEAALLTSEDYVEESADPPTCPADYRWYNA
ncbi:unnamed protein product [Arabidopsis halleri]